MTNQEIEHHLFVISNLEEKEGMTNQEKLLLIRYFQ